MKGQTKRTNFYDWEQVGKLQKYEDVLWFEVKKRIKTNTYKAGTYIKHGFKCTDQIFCTAKMKVHELHDLSSFLIYRCFVHSEKCLSHYVLTYCLKSEGKKYSIMGLLKLVL